MQREGPAPEGKQGSQFSRGRWQEGTADQMTRRFDVLIAALLLMLTLPLMLFVALAIKWESQGPVLDRHPRRGRDGRRFDMLSFRTSEYQQARVGRARKLTRVGGFLRYTRIETLPQLVNVLRGEMSIFGINTRPF
jgi:lipopolysaccharide/colanic/teichoic acid biosynthesis glycosyltransferase